MAEEAGCSVNFDDLESTIDCLREKDIEDIIGKDYNVEDYTVNLFPFVPIIDGEIIQSNPHDLIRGVLAGNPGTLKTNTSLLIGTNANEGFWSLMYFLTDIFPNKELTLEERQLSRTEYRNAVQMIFSQYDSSVSFKSNYGDIEIQF